MSSEQEVLEIRHENGEPFLRQYYKDGKLYRKLKYYHENGQLWIEEFYIDGRFEGERKIWHSNGQIKYRQFYDAGKPDGKCKTWHENGVPDKQYFYRNGELVGEYKEWDENGDVIEYLYIQEWRSSRLRWSKRYAHGFLNILKRLHSRHFFPEFSTFIISDLLKFSKAFGEA